MFGGSSSVTTQKFDIYTMGEAGQITVPVSPGPVRFASSFAIETITSFLRLFKAQMLMKVEWGQLVFLAF